jgi:hypothetical protein
MAAENEKKRSMTLKEKGRSIRVSMYRREVNEAVGILPCAGNRERERERERERWYEREERLMGSVRKAREEERERRRTCERKIRGW